MVSSGDREVGVWLREMRKASQATQREVGVRLGMSRVAVATAESGRRRLSITELARLIEVGICDDVAACDLLLTRIPRAVGRSRGARGALGD